VPHYLVSMRQEIRIEGIIEAASEDEALAIAETDDGRAEMGEHVSTPTWSAAHVCGACESDVEDTWDYCPFCGDSIH
jgi:hypothetical protein